MNSKVQFVARLGILSVLLGTTLFAVGSTIETQEDCVSGTGINIERVSSLNMEEMNNTVAFTELEPVEQRLFLEAYTESSGDFRSGDTYQSLPSEWPDYDASYVEYRNGYWKPERFHSSCLDPEIGTLVTKVGIFGSILGGLILVLVRIWQSRTTSQ